VDQQRFHVRKVWAGIYTPWMLDDLSVLVSQQRPDLIVHDAMAFAVPLLAARTGIPAVSHSTGPAFARDLLDQATEELAPLWRGRGLGDPPVAAGIYRTLHIDVWPAALQLSDLGDRGTVVPIATEEDEPSDGEALPDWFAELPDRPNVHLTLGTVFNQNPDAFRAVLEALRDEPLNLLVSVGPHQEPGELGPVPDNARVERWLPHGPLLRTCSTVICHGGAGTTLKFLREGIPLLLPQGADMFRTARACAERGLARHLAPDEVRPDAVLREFRALGADPSYRRRCAAMGAELGRLTPPAEVVPVLEDLVATH